MSKILAVFGAAGNQGSSVIKAVLGDRKLASEFRVRAISRDTSKPAIAELVKNNGVEAVAVGVRRGDLKRSG